MKIKRFRGRPEKNYVMRVSVGLTAEEAQVYKDCASAPEYFRFLYREAKGLCIHNRIEFDQQSGVKTCLICGAKNPEDFSRWFVSHEQVLNQNVKC